jgi:hypothetical protein
MPCGPEATMSKKSEFVILQTIFTPVFARGGTPEVDIIRPHNSALVAVPCTSGPTEELSIGDAGWQFFRPGAVGPVIVGESTGVGFCAVGLVTAGESVGVGFCAAGDAGVDKLVEHAVNRVISSKRQRERHFTTWFLADGIADSSLEVHRE